MKKTLIVLAAIILLLPLRASAEGRKGGRKDEFRQAMRTKAQNHRKQQKAENKDFRKSLKHSDLSQDQKIVAIKGHRETQNEENTDFHGKMHKESVGHITAKLAENDKLTDTQKQEILNHREERYQKNIAFRTQQYEENTRAIDQILGNENLSPAERRTQMKEFRTGQKKGNKERRQARRKENKEFRQSFKPEK